MRAHTIRGLALVAAIFASAGAAPAQTQPSAVTVPSGKEVRLSTHGVFKKDCTPGPLPDVKVTAPPKNGSFVVKTSTVKTSATSACANKEGPAQVVFYQAKDGYTGSDSVTYQVKSATGQPQSHTVAVTVTAASK